MIPPDKKLAAVCGLFCPGCIIYIGAHSTPEVRDELERRRGYAPGTMRCEGCRSDHRYSYCNSCKLYACAANKGIDFCGTCPDFPCADFKEFQSARPHRLELYPAQKRIRETGYETWFKEMEAYYACPQCGTLNSAYHPACRNCGATPSCHYVKDHQDEIQAYQSKITK